jgi:hypothetical protein
MKGISTLALISTSVSTLILYISRHYFEKSKLVSWLKTMKPSANPNILWWSLDVLGDMLVS